MKPKEKAANMTAKMKKDEIFEERTAKVVNPKDISNVFLYKSSIEYSTFFYAALSYS